MQQNNIYNLFSQPYCTDTWKTFLAEHFHAQFLAQPQILQNIDLKTAQKALYLGFLTLYENGIKREIAVYEVVLQPHILVERSRVQLRNLLRKYWKNIDAAFITYYIPNQEKWRLSYVSELTGFDDDGNYRTILTEPKRFTYLLGEGENVRTPTERFIQLFQKTDTFTLNDVKQAFSVDKVTREFYQEIANWYFTALNHVSFPDDIEKNTETRNATSLIRLITRMIFIWFLKQKELVPGALFEPHSLKTKLKNFNTDQNSHDYYNAILQNLFFATLNQEITKRKFAKDGDINANKQEYGVKNLFRYKELFTIPENEILNLFQSIPFLNGGLFDCLDKTDEQGKVLYLDGFSRNPKKKAIVPDFLFFGTEQIVDLNAVYDTKNKKYIFRGLIEILNRYQFTISENTTLDEDVALDPELLGKVFENLLASYNPETQTTARKATGSFYTPREIVDYMVQESLIAYLKNQLAPHTPEPEQLEPKLRKLFTHEPHDFTQNEVHTIIHALNNCKILDPACGSGAFPMGILQAMTHILQKIDPNNHIWQETQRNKIIGEEIQKLEQDKKAIEGLSDEKVRQKALNAVQERLQEIEHIFNTQYNFDDYARKLFLIENCIYGVDIQPIAIQISKLRFFISLVIDQKTDKNPDNNFGIRPLPNLETKFVAANTLIPLNKPVKAQIIEIRNPLIEAKEQELKRIRHEYFTATTRKQKLDLQKQDKAIRQEIATLLENDDWNTLVAQQIASFDPYNQNTSSQWFDPEWMFGLKPQNNGYFDIVIGNPPYGAKLTDNELKYTKQKYTIKTSETAILFIEKGFMLGNAASIIAYIIPKPFTYASNYASARDFLEKELVILVDCGKAFENVELETCVIIAVKNNQLNKYKSLLYEKDKTFTFIANINKELKKRFGFYPNGITETEIKIGNKIYENSILLNDIAHNSRGEMLQKHLVTEGRYPLIGGKEIDRYNIRSIKGFFNDTNLISNKCRIKTNSILVQRIIAHITKPYEHIKITACIPKTDNIFLLDTINQITINDSKIDIKYVWSLLNSKLVNWYCYLFVLGKAIRTMQFDNPITARLPIFNASESQQAPFIALANEILAIKEQNPDADVSHLERQIDILVYKLYNLTYDEVKVIDPLFPLSAEEYEAM